MSTGALPIFSSRAEEIEWLNRAVPKPKLSEPIFKDREEELSWLNHAIPKPDSNQGILKKDFRPKTR